MKTRDELIEELRYCLKLAHWSPYDDTAMLASQALDALSALPLAAIEALTSATPAQAEPANRTTWQMANALCVHCYQQREAHDSATNECPRLSSDDDLIAVPRSLIGAACSAIDKKRDAPKVLAKLRCYSFATPASQTPAEGAAHPLDLYAKSYEQMGRDGDGRVHCSSVAIDIRQNMIPVTRALAQAPEAAPQPTPGSKP
jgi:hypothetical protein